MGKFNLENVRNAMERQDKTREQVIRESRKVIIASKTAIGAVHRDELAKAEIKLNEMKADLEKLKNIVRKCSRFAFEGIYKVAVQEYVEALSLLEFVKNGKIIGYNEDFGDYENYLMGLCDLSGEMVRKAINSSIKEDFGMAIRIRKALEELYIELSKFDFKNGELRRKYDGIKYDLKKLDDLVFQLKMKDRI